MQSNIKLVVIKDALDYAQTEQASHVERGTDLFLMLKSIYPDNIPINTRWYLNDWDVNSDVTPACASDIRELNEIGGTIYVVTYPGDPVTAIVTAISIVVSVAVAFLMPMPPVPGSGAPTAPPSPNNALAQRTNRQRLGGRVPAIFGEVWSVPDLVAQTYSVYINHEQIEYSDMCVGEGFYNIIAAKDDSTAIGLIEGSNVRVYDPGINTYNDAPTLEFGNSLTVAEQNYDNYSTRRYSSVNGQVLAVPENYLICDSNVIFKPPNIVKITNGSGFDVAKFAVGETIQIEDADTVSASSGTTYNLSGYYTITSTSSTQLTLNSPELVNTAWVTLAANDTQTNASSPVLSTESRPLWQGWHYISDNDLDLAIMNFVAPQGIYTTHLDGDKFAAFDIAIIVEVQGLDENSEPYSGAVAKFDHRFNIFGRTAKLNSAGTAYTFTTSEEARQSAALTQTVALFGNPGGSRLRVRRGSRSQKLGKQFMSDEVKFVDLYSAKRTSDSAYATSVNATLVKTKTKATEGATALKERKLSLLVQRRITDKNSWQGNVLSVAYNDVGAPLITLTAPVDFKGQTYGTIFFKTSGGLVEVRCYPRPEADRVILSQLPNYPLLPTAASIGVVYYFVEGSATAAIESLLLNPSKRIDDIIYHIATSDTTGNLTPNDLNMVQITAEVDAQIEYFGTDLCAQFCGTFDSVDISTEEMIQTVANAGFFTAYRINNKIHLHFERQEPYSTVAFNSHNITPDSFEYSESFGSRDDYDAVEVTYTSPKDDAKLTLTHPTSGGIKVQKVELVGVRNNVQAHMHLMRIYQKNLNSYKTCNFVGADESAIVLPTNRIDVANQHRADTQQGSIVDYIKTTDTGRETLKLSAPPVFNDNGQGTLYVQTTEAKVESFTVFASDNDPYVVEVGVNSSFSGNVSVGHHNVVNATYRFVPKINLSNDQDSYLVTKKDPAENPFTHRLTCINYSDKYYQNDKDFITGNVRLNN